jgi:hypothetical protein
VWTFGMHRLREVGHRIAQNGVQKECESGKPTKPNFFMLYSEI